LSLNNAQFDREGENNTRLFRHSAGTLLNQKHAVHYKTLTSLQCLLNQTVPYTFFQVVNKAISNMNSECQVFACRLSM